MKRTPATDLRWTLGVLAIVSSACVTTTTNIARERPIPAVVDVEKLTIAALDFDADPDGFAYVDARTGSSLSFADVSARAQAAEAVLVGEQHDQGSHHRLQARIIEAMASEGLAVGLEMVERQNQGKLDRFNSGDLDVDGLFAALDWDKTWGHASELYRLIFDASRNTSARMVALNAPRDLVRRVAKTGVAALSDEDKALMPEMDLDDKEHREKIEAIFREHHPPTNASAIENFYAAQVLWDETMADRSAAALDDGATRIAILAGVGHVMGYRGIYQRVLRRRPGTKMLTIVPVTVDLDEDPLQSVKDAIGAHAGDILAVRRPREVINL